MRWFVEVATLSSGGAATKVTVDAPGWQAALSQVRTSRADTAPLSSFTIEVLSEGYRATNAAARVRYQVTRAPDDAAVTADAPPPSVPPPSSAPISTPASIAASAMRRSAKTVPIGARTTAAVVAAAADAVSPPPPPGAVNAPAVSAAPAAPASSAAKAPSVPPAAAPRPTAPPRPKPTIGKEHGEVFFRRGEDPNSKAPLTYRELAVVVPVGTTTTIAGAAAHVHLDLVRWELDQAHAPAGRLVQLAIFDHRWEKRPERPPIVTLKWKDWSPEPIVTFPSASHSGAAPPNPTAELTPATRAPSRPRMDAVGVSAEIAAAALVEAPLPKSIPPAAAAPSVPIAPVVPSAPVAPPVATASSAPPIAAPVAAPIAAPTASAAPVAPALAAKIPTASRAKRPEDLMADLFEAMHDLHFLRDALEGADFILDLLRDKLPSKVAIIHFYDINQKTFVIVKARAPVSSILGMREREGDGLLTTAVKKGNGLLLDAINDARWARDRYVAAGHEPQSIVLVPVKQGQRYLGAIEVADHVDGQPFSEAELHGITYIGEQFGEFVAERGVKLTAADTGGFAALDAGGRRP